MKTRERIFKRDNYLCQCAKCKASNSPLPAEEADHIIPLTDGGLDEDSNLQSLSTECHKRKSAEEAAERAAGTHAYQPPADSPLEFLKAVMNNPEQNLKERIRCAVAAAQYEHLKKGDGGKKDEVADKAKTAAKGRFGASAAPLRSVK